METPSKPPWRFTNAVIFFSRWYDASFLRPVPLVCILGLTMITFLRSPENTLLPSQWHLNGVFRPLPLRWHTLHLPAKVSSVPLRQPYTALPTWEPSRALHVELPTPSYYTWACLSPATRLTAVASTLAPVSWPLSSDQTSHKFFYPSYSCFITIILKPNSRYKWINYTHSSL